MLRTHPAESALDDIPAARLDRVQNALNHLSQYGEAYIAATEYGDLVAIAEGWTDERRAERLAAAAGAEVAYSENWTTCDNCSILVFVDTNLMGGGLIWISDCAVICRHCLENDASCAVAYLEYVAQRQEDNPHAAPEYLEIDPTGHGYAELIRYADVLDVPRAVMPYNSRALIGQTYTRGPNYWTRYDSCALYVPLDDDGMPAMPDGYSLDGSGWTAPDGEPGGAAEDPRAAIVAAWTHYLAQAETEPA